MDFTVDGERLRTDLEANARFGSIETGDGRGRTVLVGSEANRRARDHLVARMEAIGLDVEVDRVGNTTGVWVPDGCDEDEAPVAVGSHLDSVPEGGIFDGPLGVYAGLEAIRTLQEVDLEINRPLTLVSFTEEEGARFDSLLGSSVAAGQTSVESALERTDENGTTLRGALEEIGYLGSGVIDASNWDAWVELHVEQGRRLQRASTSVGVVSAITGVVHLEVEITGEQNHAGTTTMAERTDPLPPAAEFILAVEDIATQQSAEPEIVVGTVGKIRIAPNATNVIPGNVQLGVDIRDISWESLREIEQELAAVLTRLEEQTAVDTRLRRVVDLEPISMADRCIDAFQWGCDVADRESIPLHSGAGHDSMVIGSVTDAGMLFAPSEGGISHSPSEWTSWEDCRTATEILTAGLYSLCQGPDRRR